MSKEAQQAGIARAQREIDARKALVSASHFRQKYHFMAQEGWLNDPNGLIWFRSQYHFFYQYNPFGSFWSQMYWGHAVSTDLLHWQYLPVALVPCDWYDNHPQGGCFSGSAIVHDGRLWLLYTGTTNQGKGFVQQQCAAFSDDGVTFTKYEGNPVLPQPDWVQTAFFRDPKVWEHGAWYYMLVGARRGDYGQALLYRSKNLTEWEFLNTMCESRGELGYMFECPDCFSLDGQDVLLFSPMGLKERSSVNLVGKLDYDTGKFSWNIMGETDWGNDYYAPQSFEDSKGRRILVSWANCWDWMPFWKDWGPTYRDGWCGHFNVPRTAHLDAKGRLSAEPVEELKSLRCGERARSEFAVDESPVSLDMTDGSVYDLELKIDRTRTTAKALELILRSDGDMAAVVTFDFHAKMLYFDRDHSDGWSRGRTKSPLLLEDDVLDIRVLSDTISLEIFSEHYRTNHSNNIYASAAQNKNYLRAVGGKVWVKSVRTYKMNACME